LFWLINWSLTDRFYDLTLTFVHAFHPALFYHDPTVQAFAVDLALATAAILDAEQTKYYFANG